MLKSAKIILVSFMFFLAACVVDWQANIAVVENDTSSRLLIAKQPYDLMTDSTLYNERFSETWIETNQSRLIALPNIKLKSQPDSARCYLYIFNSDSVDKYRGLKKTQGIIRSAFIRKVEIQLNKIKEPLDTIFIK